MTDKTLKIIANLYFFPFMFLNMTLFSFKKNSKLFRQFKHLSIAWTFDGLSSLCSPQWWGLYTIEALTKLISGKIIDTYRGVPLQHSEMQKLYTIILSEGFFKICLILHQKTFIITTQTSEWWTGAKPQESFQWVLPSGKICILWNRNTYKQQTNIQTVYISTLIDI